MDWFNQLVVFSMGSGFFRWFGCWLMLVAPTAFLVKGISGTINDVFRRN